MWYEDAVVDIAMLRSRCRGRSRHPRGHWIWQSSKDRMAFDQIQLRDWVWSQKDSPGPRRIYLSLKLLSHFQTTNFHSILSRNSLLQPVFQPSWIPVMSANHTSCCHFLSASFYLIYIPHPTLVLPTQLLFRL